MPETHSPYLVFPGVSSNQDLIAINFRVTRYRSLMKYLRARQQEKYQALT